MPGATDTRTRIVQSRHNARVKELRAALARPAAAAGRAYTGDTAAPLIGLEGFHLVQEALLSGIAVHSLFVRDGSEGLLAQLPGEALARVPEVLTVSAEALASATTTEAPQGIAALAAPRAWHPADLFRAPAPLVVVLDGVQDPGNVGTILRSAEAFGATGLLALPGTAGLWSPKTLRASMGSAFRLPTLRATTEEALALLAERGLRSLAAVASDATPAPEAELGGALALLIGSEGAGLSAPLLAQAQGRVTLPCPGPVESLNAAVAASILLYECSRQRLVRVESQSR